ncbi:Multivesicular body subunit 12B [Acropora cervicornis]|uniref:Multivesicular body subunit 12B n=1 Tax=Acropora cervicornis TaxID=6130 RepID=A0AAD9Q070_ACRCE|nr:Multivesicular body subunit 12B [Acropora cervicornis]
MQLASLPPITNVKIVSQKDRCPPNYFMLAKTVQGHDGQLFDSTWRQKGKRYLCFSREVGESVVEDITVVGEDDDRFIPTGFTAIVKAHDDDEKALRKHLLCLKLSKAAVNAVCDIVLINKNKGETVPSGFHSIVNEVNDLTLCYKVAPILRAQYTEANAVPQHTPSTASTGQHWYILKQNLQILNAKEPSIEGLPFVVNYKFEILWKKSGPTVPNMQSLSVTDINSKVSHASLGSVFLS